VLVGREDALLPVSASEALAREIPGARLSILEGGGHAFAAEIAEAFNAAVLGFLAAAQRGRA
jgi:pimeloyl-ACP methyl ester carboxylesterase